MANRDIALETATITEAIKKLPKDRIWGSVRLTFMSGILVGQAVCLETQYTLTWDWQDEDWSDNSCETETL